MSETSFEFLLGNFNKTKDLEKLYKLLVAIRRDLDNTKNKGNIKKLCESGHLKPVIALLQSPHKKLVDVSLSILGNASLDESCAREMVAHHNIFSSLHQVLKKYGKDDSINGRSYRIIGNLSQHRDMWGSILIEKKPQIVTYIVEFLKNLANSDNEDDITEGTIIMAVRCLRLLLNSQTLMTLVKKFTVLNVIGMLLIKYGQKWIKEKSYEGLLNNIIRLLQEYSRYKYYPSIMEMRKTELGDSLIYLSKVLRIAPRKIVKIVMNFIRICQLKSDLPLAEILDALMNALEEENIVKELKDECVEYIQCVCYLLSHPSIRNTPRCAKSIPLLIKLLHDFDKPTNNILECCILIIITLNKCKYDVLLITDQLKCNVIEILIQKLYWISGSSKTFNLKHRGEKKRKYKFTNSILCSKRFEMSYDDLRQPKSPGSSDEETDFLFSRSDRSPSPASSSDSEANISWPSPSSSPRSLALHDFADSDSDDYSPVCSEADPTDTPIAVESDDEDPASVNFDKSINPPEECEDEEAVEVEEVVSRDSSMTINLKQKLLSEIAKLLKTYITIKPPVPQLATPELLTALIKCSGHFEWAYSDVDTIDLICRILDSYQYLLPLMQTDFIPMLYTLTEAQHGLWCIKCKLFQQIGNTILKKLSTLAESGAGKGDIAHHLLKGSNAVKKQMVLVVPYIVRNRSTLGKLMIQCGGLNCLLKLLEADSEMQKRSIKVICAMASTKLAISNPKQYTNLQRPKIVADKYKFSDCSDNKVTFRLDDGSTLAADRDFLSRKSDFFNTLLNGSFKESSEAEIGLHHASNKALRCLFHLLQYDIDKSETVEIELDLATLLDIILLSDRYLMIDLCVFLTDCVQQFKIAADTVPTIYNWSLESQTNLLRVECVAYALVGEITDRERFRMFENLFSLGYSKELVDDIQKLLVRYLSLNNENKNKETAWYEL